MHHVVRALEGWLGALGVGIFALWITAAGINPLALAALVALYTAGYVFMRMIMWMNNDRFSPARQRVGVSWALAGFDPEAAEFDLSPVRVYCLLLGILTCGLILAPAARWAMA